MKQWLKKKDGLGATPQMTYKSNESFGTACGGCCSVIARCSVLFYVSVVLFGFFSDINFNEDTQVEYHSVTDASTYILKSEDGFPAISLWYKLGRPDQEVNNMEFYEVTYTATTPAKSGEAPEHY